VGEPRDDMELNPESQASAGKIGFLRTLEPFLGWFFSISVCYQKLKRKIVFRYASTSIVAPACFEQRGLSPLNFSAWTFSINTDTQLANTPLD
jgi:hypothetical protein